MTGREHGQASVEVVALLPAVVLLVLVAVWAVSALFAVSAAQDDARRRALAATGSGGGVAVVTGVGTVPALPGLRWGRGGTSVTAAVRLP